MIKVNYQQTRYGFDIESYWLIMGEKSIYLGQKIIRHAVA